MAKCVLFQHAYMPERSKKGHIDPSFRFHTNLRVIFEIVDHFSEFWGREDFWWRIQDLLDFRYPSERYVETIILDYCYGRKVFKRGASEQDSMPGRLAELADRINHVISHGPAKRPSCPWADQADAWRSRLHRVLGELGVLFGQVKLGTCAPELKISGSAAAPDDSDVRRDERDDFSSTPSLVSRPLPSYIPAKTSSSNASYEHSTPSGRKKQSRSLWIGNVPRTTTSRDVEDEFRRYGRITSVRILSNRYCAFVNFERTEDAVAAKEILDGKRVFPGAEPAVINFTASHDKDHELRRRSELGASHESARPGILSSGDVSTMSSWEQPTPSEARTVNKRPELPEDQTGLEEVNVAPKPSATNRIPNGTEGDRHSRNNISENAERATSDPDAAARSKPSEGAAAELPTHNGRPPEISEHRTPILQTLDESLSSHTVQAVSISKKRRHSAEAEQPGIFPKRVARGSGAILFEFPVKKHGGLITESNASHDLEWGRNQVTAAIETTDDTAVVSRERSPRAGSSEVTKKSLELDDSQSVTNAAQKRHAGVEGRPAKDGSRAATYVTDIIPTETMEKSNSTGLGPRKGATSPESAVRAKEVGKLEELWNLHLKQVEIYQQQVHDLESALHSMQAQQEVRDKSLEDKMQVLQKALDQHVSDSLTVAQDQQTRTQKVEQTLGPLEEQMRQAVTLQTRVESIESNNIELRDEVRRYSDDLQKSAKVGSEVEALRIQSKQQTEDRQRLADLEGQVKQLAERLSQRLAASEPSRSERLEAELQDTKKQLRQAHEQLRQQSASARATPPTPPMPRLSSALSSTRGQDWPTLPERDVDSCLKAVHDELCSMREAMRLKIKAMDAAEEPDKEKYRISDVSYELGELLEKVNGLM